MVTFHRIALTVADDQSCAGGHVIQFSRIDDEFESAVRLPVKRLRPEG
jgi:hypothetical protein